MKLDIKAKEVIGDLKYLNKYALDSFEMMHNPGGCIGLRKNAPIYEYSKYKSKITYIYWNSVEISPPIYKEFLDEYKKYHRMVASINNSSGSFGGSCIPRFFVGDIFGGKYKSIRVLKSIIFIILFIPLLFIFVLIFIPTYLFVFTLFQLEIFFKYLWYGLFRDYEISEIYGY